MSDVGNVAAAMHALIARSGMSQTAFAQAMGYKHRSALRHYIDIHNPPDYLPYEFTVKASDVLVGRGDPPIVLDDILRLGPASPSISLVQTYIKDIPLISWVEAGRLARVDAVVGYEDFDRVKVTDLPDGEYIALRVDGESMNRIVPSGSLIVVNITDKELLDGRLYVVTISGETTFKRYRANPARFEPFSTEARHETIFPLGAVEIVGKVVQAINKL